MKGLSNETTNANGVARLGDIIIAVDSHPVRQIDNIINYIDSLSPGDNVKLTVNRGGKIMDLTAILQPRPASEAASLPPPQ